MNGGARVRGTNRRVTQTKDEMALGIRALLASPLLTRERDEVAFTAVRRRRTELTGWFDYFCGWTLTVEPRQGYARLAKVRSVDSHLAVPRPARRVRGVGAPFDRRRYTLFCLAAAELTVLSRTTIGLLAQRVAHTCALEEGIADFDSSVRTERAALVDALLLLEDQGALTAVDGATESYLAGEDALVLYRADTARLARLISAPVPPSRLGGTRPNPAGLVVEERYGPPTPDTGTDDAPDMAGGEGPDDDSDDDMGSVAPTHHQRLLRARHSLMRRLLDDPVVYLKDLSTEEAEYAATLTGRGLLRRAAAEAGFRLEERAEGYLLVDPESVATDDVFPGEGHVKQTALLLMDVLLASGEPLPWSALVGEVEGLLERKPTWARGFRGEGGAARLAGAALEVLVGHGLARAGADAGVGADARTEAGEGSVGEGSGRVEPHYRSLSAAHRYAVDRAAFSEGAPSPNRGEGHDGDREQGRGEGQA